MSRYRVEYLSVIDSKAAICQSVSAFNNLLQTYENIKIRENEIEFEGETFSFDVLFGEIEENVERYYHVKIYCDKRSKIKKFKLLLKAIRNLLHMVSGKTPETLWDDVSAELATKAYPIIHELENLMRKLITKFMFTSVGLAWIKDTVPKEVSESRNTFKDTSQNYLYEVDFIQLSNFLFNEYSTVNSKALIEKIKSAKKITDLELLELKDLIPLSNWERYFSPIVDCDSDYLKNRWKKLYELRCLVAHNKFIGEKDFQELQNYAGEVKGKLTQAIESLDKVKITSEQKEEVAENIVGNMSSLNGQYVRGWNVLLNTIFDLYYLKIETDTPNEKIPSPKDMLLRLIKEGVISPKFRSRFLMLQEFRDILVHHSDLNINEEVLRRYLNQLESARTLIQNIIQSRDHDLDP